MCASRGCAGVTLTQCRGGGGCASQTCSDALRTTPRPSFTPPATHAAPAGDRHARNPRRPRLEGARHGQGRGRSQREQEAAEAPRPATPPPPAAPHTAAHTALRVGACSGHAPPRPSRRRRVGGRGRSRQGSVGRRSPHAHSRPAVVAEVHAAATRASRASQAGRTARNARAVGGRHLELVRSRRCARVAVGRAGRHRCGSRCRRIAGVTTRRWPVARPTPPWTVGTLARRCPASAGAWCHQP